MVAVRVEIRVGDRSASAQHIAHAEGTVGSLFKYEKGRLFKRVFATLCVLVVLMAENMFTNRASAPNGTPASPVCPFILPFLAAGFCLVLVLIL